MSYSVRVILSQSARTLALVFAVVAASGQAKAQSAATKVSIPVRMISRQEFCRRLADGLKQFSLAAGFNAKQSGLIANSGADDLVIAFKSGRATDYLNPVALTRLAMNEGPDRGGTLGENSAYIPMANFLGPALGIMPSQTVLALSAAELRFIPHVQQAMNIVVIAQNAAPLTPERAKAVAATAARLKVRIHVLWVGEALKSSVSEPSAAATAEANAMAFLAAVTGGTFADLSGSDHCGRSL